MQIVVVFIVVAAVFVVVCAFILNIVVQITILNCIKVLLFLFISAKDRVDIICAFPEFSFAGAFGCLSRCASFYFSSSCACSASGFSFNSCRFKVSSRYESNSLDLKDRS
jgi:hypothetical protein